MSNKINLGITGKDALAQLAAMQGITPAQALKNEIAKHRAFSGRGALYRANIIGGKKKFF